MSRRILFIGGSPCSGKSTIAERIAEQYGAYYFKVDDYLEEFMNKAAQKGYPTCKKVNCMSPEEIWMRDPEIQNEEEFEIYEEISEFVFAKLETIEMDFIVTEGAAYTPKVMSKYAQKNYITIVPSADFQVEHYRQREWVQYVLAGCSDPEKAFDNWMTRDILFARRVQKQSLGYNVPCILVDGTMTPDQVYTTVRALFQLK